MLNLTGITAVTSLGMPAAPLGARGEGRLAAIGTPLPADGTRTPAFLEDVVPGVRAWSPPV